MYYYLITRLLYFRVFSQMLQTRQQKLHDKKKQTKINTISLTHSFTFSHSFTFIHFPILWVKLWVKSVKELSYKKQLVFSLKANFFDGKNVYAYQIK